MSKKKVNSDKNHENNEIEYEMENDILEESSLQNKLKKLRNALKAEKKQSQEYLTGWQTERASFANYKSEEEKKRIDRLSSMKVNLIADFFPVLDSFDMAFSDKESWESVDPAWRTGVEYIHTQFTNILEQYNVEAIDKIDVTFNPVLHEPSDIVETDNKEIDNMVAEIIQKGYKSGEFIIRPAKVKVYKYEK